MKIATGLITSLIVLYWKKMLLAGSAEATGVMFWRLIEALTGLEFVASGEDRLDISTYHSSIDSSSYS